MPARRDPSQATFRWLGGTLLSRAPSCAKLLPPCSSAGPSNSWSALVEILLRRGNLATRAAGALALGIFEGEPRLGGAAADVDRASGGAIRALLKTGDFRGLWLESATLYP